MISQRKHAKSRVLIDYPAPDQTLSERHYTFRMKADGPGCVEVALDDGPWRLCRESVGYWWFDWACVPGEHALSARMVLEDGSIRTAAKRRFKVGAAVPVPAPAF